MKQKPIYKINNWSQYNKSLINRGRINFWFDEKIADDWYSPEVTQKAGRPFVYSDIAIECILTLRIVFNLSLRSTQGFIESLIELMNLDFPCPNYTTLSIRQKSIEVVLPKAKSSGEPLHIVVDSTGVKIFGEGEWKVRQHGQTKRRTWRKLHIGVNADNHFIEAAAVTTNNVKDSEILEDLLEQIDDSISQVSADGAYDAHYVYNMIVNKGAQAVIPPRKDAVISQHGNCKGPPLARDEVIRSIKKLGLKRWKKESKYHQRNLSETAMFRIKTIFGDRLKSKKFDNQGTETLLRCRALNMMTSLGMPDSYLYE